MAWTKVPKANEALLDAAVATISGAEKRPMFGCPAYFLNGNMFVGAHQEAIILRLSPNDRELLLKHPDAVNFTPMTGRPMREYIVVPREILEDECVFGKWLQRSVDFVQGLPVKEKKKR